MSLLFLNGLMPERQGFFIRQLATRHALAGTRLPDLADVPGARSLDFQAETKMMDVPQAVNLKQRITEQTRLLAENLTDDLAHCPAWPAPGEPLDPELIEKSLRPRVIQSLLQDLQFRHFAARHPVDMVISGSDYGSHSRVIALTARDMGIPTLNLEHGFFFTRNTPEHLILRGWMPTFFTSEYVNLDNKLEVELLEQELAAFPARDTRFLALGTPIDTVASVDISRAKALSALGLNPDLTQILVLGSWQEARKVRKLVAAQIDTVDMYEDLFTNLATRDFRDRMQLTIKLHPADARPDVFPGVKAALEIMAERCGLPRPLVLADQLPELLSACDVAVTLGFSSVQFDLFLLGKPSVVMFPEKARQVRDARWFAEGTLPMKHGVCEAVTSGTQAWDRVEGFLAPERRARFVKDRAAFAARYDLRHRPVQEKTEAIMAWIDDHLAHRRS